MPQRGMTHRGMSRGGSCRGSCRSRLQAEEGVGEKLFKGDAFDGVALQQLHGSSSSSSESTCTQIAANCSTGCCKCGINVCNARRSKERKEKLS